MTDNTPRVEIVIALEAEPRFRVICSDNEERERLSDWIANRPDLARIIILTHCAMAEREARE